MASTWEHKVYLPVWTSPYLHSTLRTHISGKYTLGQSWGREEIRGMWTWADTTFAGFACTEEGGAAGHPVSSRPDSVDTQDSIHNLTHNNGGSLDCLIRVCILQDIVWATLGWTIFLSSWTPPFPGGHQRGGIPSVRRGSGEGSFLLEYSICRVRRILLHLPKWKRSSSPSSGPHLPDVLICLVRHPCARLSKAAHTHPREQGFRAANNQEWMWGWVWRSSNGPLSFQARDYQSWSLGEGNACRFTSF